ncbi:MAG: alcohol dehydrogenase [Kosmotogales bacterium]|nr:alcohol dehydrogenase [Kosmotogales bacterium]
MIKSNFNFYVPTNIIFGPGRLKELATIKLPGKKALIVIGGKSVKKYGYINRVEDYLKKNNVESVVFDKIQPNPILNHVMEGAQLAKDNDCDFVIGLGGGSSIDSAKSIAIMATNPGNYWDYVCGGTALCKPVPNDPLPIVAITTTAGTGTEADPWTVITNMKTEEKIGYGYSKTFPAISIVDPELMITVPKNLTAFQGMDAFFHSVEGYLSKNAQPSSDLFALETVGLISKYLPIAVNDGENIEARTAVAWANTSAGIVESTSSCISHHSMEHALSALHPMLPHGAGLILLSVSYFSFMAERVLPERFIALARIMGEDVNKYSSSEKPMAFINALKKLIKNIGLSDLRFSDYDIYNDEKEKLADNAIDTMGGLFDVDPYKLEKKDVIEIYNTALDK